MSLNPAKMQNSLKAQLDQEERDIIAEREAAEAAKAALEATAKAKHRAVKEKAPKEAD